ncbi:helix-turn-helix domain-containing protein [Promicromonospora sp. MEB111]|uniref:helix-turn-helix domain-containing protein n=1 Tax=Promicromonospora sp. MEB111 TaxID=3040301 RepID=UPI00254F7933|nr:helix-turn-helix domain-containing protein [Promicromonospora sp. MEB111]
MTAPFGPYLRSLRQSAGLTIEELSHTSGVSVRAIGDMERGVSRGPQRRTVQALAEALGLDTEQQAELADAARAGRPRAADQVPEPPRGYGLPRGPAHFVGRTAELELLGEHGRAAFGDDRTPVVVVHGPGGVGKTACVVRAAELLREAFPDGQVYVDLRGVDPEPMPTAEALRRLLLAVGLEPRAVAEDEQERADQLRDILAERRCLVVLDNAADEAQVRLLLPGDGPGMAIVTSRRTLAGLDGVTRIPIAPLSSRESAELLRTVSGGGREVAAGTEEVEPEDEDVARVARLCGHLPLALRIAGTRLASRPGWTMHYLAERLSDEDRRLANLAVGDIGVEASFSLSYLALPDQARECFRRLALVPAVDFGAPIVAVLIQADLDDAEDQLDELVDLGLLQPEGAGRYRFHDLIRLYANRRLHEEETADARATAERRMVSWLLETATTAGRVFEADGDVPPHPDRLVPLTTPDEAKAWLQAEKDTWLAALRLAAASERDELVAGLGESMRWFAADAHQWSSDWLEVFGLTLAAAARLPDRRRELWHMNRHASALLTVAIQRQSGESVLRERVEYAMEAYRLAEHAGALQEQADALCNAGEGWLHVGDAEQMLDAYSRGLELAQASGYHQIYSWATSGIGTALDILGRHDEAVDIYRALLRSTDGVPDLSAAAQHGRAGAAFRLTEALLAAGRFREVVEVGEPALAELVQLASGWTPFLHWTLGRAHAELGADREARQHLVRMIELVEDHGAWKPKPSTLARAKSMLADLDAKEAG